MSRSFWPPILDPDEAAEFLHLPSRREVLKLAREQRIPSVRLGHKRVLFLRDSLLEALKRQETPALSDRELGTAK